MWKNFKERTRRIECFEFLFSTGVPQDWIITCYGISEGKESFIHRLIRLMCGTLDVLDESPQSIVNNSCIVHSTELIYASLTHLMLLH